MSVYTPCQHGNHPVTCSHCLLNQVSRQQEEITELKARLDHFDPPNCRHDRPWGECGECFAEWAETQRLTCPFCGEKFTAESDQCLMAAIKMVEDLKENNATARRDLVSEIIEACGFMIGSEDRATIEALVAGDPA